MAKKRHVVVIGGGLAGMVVADELSQRDVAVTIIEKSSRLGGKAGADRRQFVRPDRSLEEIWVEHGFHFFPGWYRNTRRLLGQLGVLGDLADSDSLYTIRKPAAPGAAPAVYRTYSFDSAGAVLHNLFESVLPWHQALLAFYFTLDLAAEPFRVRGFLDRVSVSGLFRSRFYRNEAIAEYHQMSVLQASAIPLYELSAMSFQKVVKAFAWTPKPFVSILKGDLQSRFIEPFRARLEARGVKVVTDWVKRLVVEDGRVAGVILHGGEPFGEPADAYVVATPLEETARLTGEPVLRAEEGALEGDDGPPPLSGAWHLRSAPMAALQLYFDRRIPDLPAWHTSLFQSKYGISFVDLSQHWPELKTGGKTVLSLIAANFKPLLHVGWQEQIRHILDELLEYIATDAQGRPVFDFSDRDPHPVRRAGVQRAGKGPRCGFVAYGGVVQGYLQANVDTPLFLNTTGAWKYRPGTRTALPNLFVAGDYCRTEADLTTMESAVMSALATARDLLATLGRRADVEVLALDLPPEWLLAALKLSLFPLIAPIGAYNAIERFLQGEDASLLRAIEQWRHGEAPSLGEALGSWLEEQGTSIGDGLRWLGRVVTGRSA